MYLKTLGGLRLDGSDFRRPKSLLLLSYLAIEGPKPRRTLADLFFLHTKDPRDSLDTSLRRLRGASPGLIEADGERVGSGVPCDATALLEALDSERPEEVLELYRGPFLDGLSLALGVELEEWVFGTRELLADGVRAALLRSAEAEAARGGFEPAARTAERALAVPGVDAPEPELLARLHACLLAGGSVRAKEVEREAEGLGLPLVPTREAARARFAAADGGTEGATPNDLPATTSSFVGRARELEEIAARLSRGDVRLLTLHGIGGVGKSRLAIEAARERLAHGAYRDGVHFVRLDPLDSADLIPVAVAQALDAEPTGWDDPLAPVVDAIGERDVLLVLDNYEHLMEGATVPSRLVRTCPNLAVIVTSREVLHLEEEWVLTLEGLRYPTSPRMEPEEAATYDAVQLFLQRAAQARVGYRPGPEELPSLLELCRLVEGAPLALELAAAWVRHMPLEAIVREIRDGLAFLRSRSRDADARHESIEAVLEHSWALLGPREQAVLRKLSVFVGGFDRRGAAAVADATLPLLAGLVDKSLLRGAARGRFGMHFLVQEFTRGKLRASPDGLGPARSRFASYYGDMLGRPGTELVGPDHESALERLDLEIDNVLAAWPDLFEAVPPDRLPTAVITFSDYLFQRGRGREAIERLGAALRRYEARDAPDALVRATLLQCLAWLHGDLGDAREARRFAERSLALLDGTEHARPLAWTLRILGNLRRRQGELEEAEALMTRELAIYRKAGITTLIAPTLNNLGVLCTMAGRYPEAEALLLESVALDRRHENLSGLVIDLDSLGELYLLTHRAEQARAVYAEALDLAERLGYLEEIPAVLTGLGRALHAQDKHDQARHYLQRALTEARLAKNDRALIPALTALAAFDLDTDAGDRAGEFLARALELARTKGTPSDVMGVLVVAARYYLRLGTVETASEITDIIAGSPASWRAMLDAASKIRATCIELDGSESQPSRLGEPPSILEEELVDFLGRARTFPPTRDIS